MPVAYLDVTPELLCEFLKGLKPGPQVRGFQVAANAIPADGQVVDTFTHNHCVRICIRSASVKDGEVLEPPVLTTVAKGSPETQYLGAGDN